MPEWTTACPDWRERIVSGRSLIPFDPFFPDEANYALDFFRDDLRIVDAIGQPTFGESSRPWVIDFAGAIFGALDPETNKRLIRDFFLLISKKNGKSTDAAAIMLTALIVNMRASAEFLIIAPTIEIANNSFQPARDMVRANSALDARQGGFLHVQDHVKTITDQRTGATLKVIAADNETVSGKKATGVLVDELWLFGKRANAEAMLREATGGIVARPEGFVVYLSTQSDEPPAGVFKQKLQYFRDVRDGKIQDKRSLPVIYEYPEQMIEEKAYLDPKWWKVTNPNLGLSVSEEWIADELVKAREAGPASMATFIAKHFNVQIGGALSADGWPGAEDWESCADHELTLQTILDCCEVITIGIDYGGRDDLFSLAVLGRVPGDEIANRRRWLAWGHSWCHRIAVERRKSEASRYADFEKAGELTIVDRLGQDVDEAVDIIRTVYESGKLAGIGMDPNRVGPLLGALEEAGIRDPYDDQDIVVAVTQGRALQGAVISAERKLNAGTLTHAGQAIMGWAVSNAKCEYIGNTMLVTKKASGSAKIDPLMSLFDAVFLMDRDPEPRTRRSIYDSGEIWDKREDGALEMNAPPATAQFSRPSIFDAEWK